MPITIAAITDIHAIKEDSPLPESLLAEAIQQLAREVKPDVTLLLGDLVDDGDSAAGQAALCRLRKIVDRLPSPLIALPGNHDGDIEAFYRIFPRPPATVEVAGARFLLFFDTEEPEYNARRAEEDLGRMAAARYDGFTGPIIALQHVPLLPPGIGESPYRLINDAAAVAAMRAGNITLAISGHFHRGDTLIKHESGSYLLVPALCDPPHVFLVVTIVSEEISVARHEISRCV